MELQWARMTAWQLAEAREATAGTCVLPIGSVERHSNHLPLGTDAFTIERLCLTAAQREPVVLLPTLYYSHVKEMKNSLGAIAMETDLLMNMVETICDEASRNGFKKVILANGHGGNRFWLPLLMMDLCDAGKDYAPYFLQPVLTDDQHKRRAAIRTSDVPDMHAGEGETSVALHLFGDLVHTDRIPDEDGAKLDVPTQPAYTPIEWYSMFPDAQSGDARKASAAKGKKLVEISIESFAAAFGAIKADRSVPEHMAQFAKDMRDPGY